MITTSAIKPLHVAPLSGGNALPAKGGGAASGADRYLPGVAGTRAQGSARRGEYGASFLVKTALAAYERSAAATKSADGRGKAAGSGDRAAVKEKSRDDSEGLSRVSQGRRGGDGKPLTDQELQQLAALRSRDGEVKAHELAHLAVAGAYARGGATFQYQNGPDGRQYAVGGEVSIDAGKETSPAATITKMSVVRAAALAPADSSPQDRAVAAAATASMGQAREELRQEQLAELRNIAPGKGALSAERFAGDGGGSRPPAGSGGRDMSRGYRGGEGKAPSFRAVA